MPIFIKLMSVVDAELVFLRSRLDMTQELMDCLDAALKMSDTGESAGSFMDHFINSHILNTRSLHDVL